MFLPVLALAACGEAGPAPADFSAQDSAGIRIAENRASFPEDGAAGGGWRIDPNPSLRIGVVEGAPAYQLHRVAGAVRLSDGRIVLVDGGTQELRVYDREGAHLATGAGAGDGPGELRSARDLLRLAGDTLAIWDTSRQARSWFDAEGRFVRSQNADRSRWEGLFGDDRVADVAALLPDGSLLLRIRPVRPRANLGWYRAPLGFARASSDLAAVDSIGWFGAQEHYNVGSETEVLLRFVPFGRDTHVAAGGEPMRLFIGGADGIGQAKREGYQIHVYGSDGRLQGLIRHAVPARAPSPQEVERARQSERRMYESQGRHEEDYIAEQVRTLPVPETIPPHAELRVDAQGNLWVQEWAFSVLERRRHRIFNPEGRLVGVVDVPERFRITDIGADYVLGVWQNAENVEFVQLHALLKER